MNKPIYLGVRAGMTRREAIMLRVGNLLCRLGMHDWEEWTTYPRSVLFYGGPNRMCRHCTAVQVRKAKAEES